MPDTITLNLTPEENKLLIELVERGFMAMTADELLDERGFEIVPIIVRKITEASTARIDELRKLVDECRKQTSELRLVLQVLQETVSKPAEV